MGILFTAPQLEYKVIEQEWQQKLIEVAEKGTFVNAAAVGEFEKAFANYNGVEFANGLDNGTNAIYLALKALGIGPGDEVITVTNTFIATVAAIHHAGAKPVLVDCRESDFLVNPNQVLERITNKTKAIIFVHLYGKLVDVEAFRSVCQEKNIKILEDCAQAAGAHKNGRFSGSFGDVGCFSFYPDKNLGALGDAGAIITRSEKTSQVVRMLANHGGLKRYEHTIAGGNSRLDSIQAAALTIKLKYLDRWNAHRRSVAAMYNERLSGIESLIVPTLGDESHVFHLYVIRVEKQLREKLKKHLQKMGILTGIHYPAPVHATQAFEFLGYRSGDFPISEKLSQEILSLPMHMALSVDDVDKVTTEVRTFLRGV